MHMKKSWSRGKGSRWKGLHWMLVKKARQNYSLALRKSYGSDQELQLQRTMDCLIVLHNVLRTDSESQQLMQPTDILDLLIKITKTAGGNLQIIAVMTLCLIVDNEQHNHPDDIIKVSRNCFQEKVLAANLKELTLPIKLPFYHPFASYCHFLLFLSKCITSIFLKKAAS